MQSDAPPQGTSAAAEPDQSQRPRSGGAVRYLALGDSLTQGVGAPDESTGAFPALLAEHWRADGCEVELQNVGISGYTAAQILAEQVPQIESFQPNIITFQAGGNDIANGVPIDEYRENVKQVLEFGEGERSARHRPRAERVVHGRRWASTTVKAFRHSAWRMTRCSSKRHLPQGAEFVDMRPLYARAGRPEPVGRRRTPPDARGLSGWADKLSEEVPAPCK